VRDDSEIRGHRRTYIGAMPGRIVQAIKRAGENNPVFLLDEVDKLSRSYNGDPASALLEVLDPEQNSTFLDHYLDVPFDLSKVFFIATANTLETIPGPLLDRMEVIDLTGYTSAEKLHIAKNHLVPKQKKEHGIAEEALTISDDALLRVITHYTREAGVRELQRSIATICRASTEKVIEREKSGQTAPVEVRLEQLDDLLGPERFIHEVAERLAPPGVVTGLAWTPQGGEILFIEAGLMPGSGRLTLTGQLGDVMKESAQIALSLVRSNLAQIVDKSFEFDKKDIHIHVPAGAIPKDGPSAGITMLTTIASLFSGRSVSPKVAMTGEITLRGAVMPVGGIKEKVMAAHRAGIEKIIMSKRNEKDLREVPDEIKAALKFEFVETAAEVFRAALGLEVATSALPLQQTGVPPAAIA
jgi:ATP-dependent Lon protease